MNLSPSVIRLSLQGAPVFMYYTRQTDDDSISD